MSNTIYFHKIRESHGHMSNFYPVWIKVDGYGDFKTSEHLYQALKYTHNTEYFKTIQMAENAWSAAKLGRVSEPPLRPDWDNVKLDAMRFTVAQKYLQNEDIQKLLLDTGDAIIVEYAPHKDYFWGWYRGQGENWLGIILQEVREMFKNEGYIHAYIDEASKNCGL
jgi:ribA/ribD-fused uncharacterized protein